MNTVPQTGKWNEISSTINDNFSLIELQMLQMENAILYNKGVHATIQKLTEAYPQPMSGSFAYVGTATPYAIYIYDKEWKDSGVTGVPTETNFSNIDVATPEKAGLMSTFHVLSLDEASKKVLEHTDALNELGKQIVLVSDYATESIGNIEYNIGKIQRINATLDESTSLSSIYMEGVYFINGEKEYVEDLPSTEGEKISATLIVKKCEKNIFQFLILCTDVKQESNIYIRRGTYDSVAVLWHPWKKQQFTYYSETNNSASIKIEPQVGSVNYSELTIDSSGISLSAPILNLRGVSRIQNAVFDSLQVQSDYNIAAKSIISSDIDVGEFKVLHRGSPEGFIIRTVEDPNNPSGRYLVEILSTDGWGAYKYTFPSKSGQVALLSDIPSSSSFVDLSSAQTISGVKTFNNNIKLNNKTVISTSIDAGELKVLHNNSSKGFIVRTKNGSDDLLPLELLTTNGYSSYTYTFPKKSGEVVLKSDFDALAQRVQALEAMLTQTTDVTKE